MPEHFWRYLCKVDKGNQRLSELFRVLCLFDGRQDAKDLRDKCIELLLVLLLDGSKERREGFHGRQPYLPNQSVGRFHIKNCSHTETSSSLKPLVNAASTVSPCCFSMMPGV